MPVISKVLTPMRLLAMPRRTPRFGSLCFAKSSLSAAARPSMSRSSPPTTTPSGRSIARHLQELRRPVRVGDPRRSDLRRADLQPDEPSLALRGSLLLLRRLGRLLALQRPWPSGPWRPARRLRPCSCRTRPRASRTAAASPSAASAPAAPGRRLPCPCPCRTRARASRTAAASPSAASAAFRP